MATVRVLVLRAPGTNCDRETAFAFESAGASVDRLHVNQLLRQQTLLNQYQVLCVPGGFSYGDDIGAGTILASQFRRHLAESLRDFYESGKLILGICNGFQTLLKAGLFSVGLPQLPVTLGLNDSGVFEDRWVDLEVVAEQCVFLRGLQHLQLPVAHAEGKLLADNKTSVLALEDSGMVALRYRCEDSSTGGCENGYPQNPNGSWNHIAGLCDVTGRVLGLMPHPERHIDGLQNPRWTRRSAETVEGQGLAIFRNAVRYWKR